MSSHFEYLSTIRPEEMAFFANHLEKTFAKIGELTGKAAVEVPPIAVHIFQTTWQVRDFLDRETPVDVTQMDRFSGVTWFDGDRPAMATSAEDQSLHAVCKTLQHELFHCWEYITTGSPMAPWLSEGYAQRFEDVIVTDQQTITGLINAGRLERLCYAADLKEFMPLPLLMMTEQDHIDGWARFDPAQMTRFYDQAWAFVHFLNEVQPLCWSLEKFIEHVRHSSVIEAISKSIDEKFDLPKVSAAFEAWFRNALPDPLSAAMDRLEILASWMLLISGERSLKNMKSVEKLRKIGSFYQAKNFLHGRRSLPLSHPSLYRYQTGAAAEPVEFEVLPEEGEDLLPRLRASDMEQLKGGALTLAWHRGRLGPTPDFRFESAGDKN